MSEPACGGLGPAGAGGPHGGGRQEQEEGEGEGSTGIYHVI